MKDKKWAGLVSAVLLAGTVAGLRAELSHSSYEGIVPRNAFGLLPLRRETATSPPPPGPAFEVKLTGIVTLGGMKKALLQVEVDSSGKKIEYLPPLVEGDRQERVEVVSIDPEKGAVVIRIDGNPKTLTFAKDAPKSGRAAPAVLPPIPYICQPR
jgi:hypothetical protein